jgi:hypothetical protein
MSRPLDAGANGRGARANRNSITAGKYSAKFSTLQSAAALARATHAHLAEELDARRARGRPTRALCQLLPIADYLRDRLDTLAARESEVA